MFKNGYIKLYRKIVDWEWYTEINTCKLFLHMLIMANHDEQKWRGEVIEKGTFITSNASLSNETGLSVRQVRTAIKNLLKTGDIKVIATNRNTKIIVVKYDLYQFMSGNSGKLNDTQNDTDETNKRQSNDKQATTNKNKKNKKNVKNIKKEINKEKKSYGEFMNVKLTDEEYQKLNDRKLIYMIERLSAYLESTGKTYKSHYATILNWSRKDGVSNGKSIKSSAEYGIKTL